MRIVVSICYHHSTKVFLPGKSHGQRSLMGYSLRGPKESDTTERLTWRTYGRTPRPQDINMFAISLDFKEWHRDSSGGTLCHCPQEGNLPSGRTMGGKPGSTELLYELQNLGKDIDPPCWLTDSSFVMWGYRLSKLEISKFRTSRSLCSPSGSRGRETFSLSEPKTQGSEHRTE